MMQMHKPKTSTAAPIPSHSLVFLLIFSPDGTVARDEERTNGMRFRRAGRSRWKQSQLLHSRRRRRRCPTGTDVGTGVRRALILKILMRCLQVILLPKNLSILLRNNSLCIQISDVVIRSSMLNFHKTKWHSLEWSIFPNR